MDVDANVVETEVVLGFGSLSCYAAVAAEVVMDATTAVETALAETVFGSSSYSSAVAVSAEAVMAVAADATADADATTDVDAARHLNLRAS